jgi:hypothetical protein
MNGDKEECMQDTCGKAGRKMTVKDSKIRISLFRLNFTQEIRVP